MGQQDRWGKMETLQATSTVHCQWQGSVFRNNFNRRQKWTNRRRKIYRRGVWGPHMVPSGSRALVEGPGKKRFSILGPFFLVSQTIWFPVLRKKKIIWQILEKTFANFTWKFKEYLTLKFQEKNSVRKKKHSAPLPMMLNGLSLTIFSLRSPNTDQNILTIQPHSWFVAIGQIFLFYVFTLNSESTLSFNIFSLNPKPWCILKLFSIVLEVERTLLNK